MLIDIGSLGPHLGADDFCWKLWNVEVTKVWVKL